ncbi:MAG: cyclic nucleotide-binding domain-containing protein [Myxococcales bacterium]|nr:cyclic nucleotide-binding domain-containing protein [Myxococcales bacterium]
MSDTPSAAARLSELIGRTGLAEPFSASGGELFCQGDTADCMLVIDEGEVEIVARTPGDETVALARLSGQAVLGELSLIDSGLRSASARALQPTSGWRLARDAFAMLRASRSEISTAILAQLAALTCERIRARVADLVAALDSADVPRFDYRPVVERVRWRAQPAPQLERSTAELLPLFRALGDPRRYRALLDASTLYAVERGERLAVAGEQPDGAALVVLRGAVVVSIERDGRRERCGLMPPGRLLSAVALHDGGPHALDAAAREPAELLCIEPEALERLRADPVLGYALDDALIRELTYELRLVSAQLSRLAAHGRVAVAGA